jgi:hypothetical protein
MLNDLKETSLLIVQSQILEIGDNWIDHNENNTGHVPNVQPQILKV